MKRLRKLIDRKLLCWVLIWSLVAVIVSYFIGLLMWGDGYPLALIVGIIVDDVAFWVYLAALAIKRWRSRCAEQA